MDACVCGCGCGCVGECMRLTYHKVYGSVCTDYFLHSCLPAIGGECCFVLFFSERGYKNKALS